MDQNTNISMSPKASELTVQKPLTIDFPDAIRNIAVGNKVTRLGWGDMNIYLILESDGRLKIHKADGKLYDLIVSDGDIYGTDWVIIS